MLPLGAREAMVYRSVAKATPEGLPPEGGSHV